MLSCEGVLCVGGDEGGRGKGGGGGNVGSGGYGRWSFMVGVV